YQDASVSLNWIDRFHCRHNIVFTTVCGEGADVDGDVILLWKVIWGLIPRDVFNFDETGLFFCLQPDKTMCFNKGWARNNKERLTVLLGANSDRSEKRLPLVIGKAQKPRCFKDVHSLPCTYRTNKKAWMTSQLFTEFLMDYDNCFKREKYYFLCITAHKDMHLHNITLPFLPPNTSHLQTTDQGIIKNFKACYRKQLVKWHLPETDNRDKPVTVLDALYIIRSAWRPITTTCVQNCFYHSGVPLPHPLPSEMEVNEEEEIKSFWSAINMNHTSKEFVNIDDDLPICQEHTNDEICQDVLCVREEECVKHEHSDEEAAAMSVPSNLQALQLVNDVRRFISSTDDIPEHLF
uniref:HTH CENPB-type domain-containing protein n=1 Tax=Latimeria chalumnae TaxID=7897 RepID=H3AH53_LATCH